jgi:opacity protein-like surface antigen
MKKLLLAAVLLLGFSVMVMAQDTPKAEIFGGYTYFRPDTQGLDNINMNGWNASAAFNATGFAALVADFGGYYGSMSDVDVKVHSLMFGPKFSVRVGRVTPFVQGLFGFGHVNVKSGDTVIQKENDFAMAYGGGIDINVTDMVAVRPAQVEYFMLKSGQDRLNNFRYSAGIVIKLGKR